MKRVELTITGMTCDHCARTAERALRSVPGTQNVEVDYSKRRGTLSVADGVATGDLTAALARAGYAGSSVEDVAAPGAGRVIRDGADPADGDGAFDTDLVVVGTGGAGMAAAIRGAELGRRVTIVESGTVGGTCVNVGCIPSKNLIAAAEHVHAVRQGFPGIASVEPAVDWAALIGQKDRLVDHLRNAKYLDVLAAHPGITLVRGRARFGDDGTVEVDGRPLRARGVVLATGTSPWAPPIPGLEEAGYRDSTSIMELEEPPESLVVLGASAVGLELGQTFARFGASVTVIELLPRILPGEDTELTDLLRGYLEEEGLEIVTGARPVRVGRRDGRLVVSAERNGERLEVEAEEILVATGRRANTEGLNLPGAGVVADAKGFVRVDEALRTSRPGVYAAGDVTGGPGFVYVAAAGGRVAAENALQSGERSLDLSVVPRVTFTSPQLGAVGLTEEEARNRGYAVQVGRLPVEHLPRAAVTHDLRGLVKIVAEEGTGRLLGLHAVGSGAGDLLGEAAFALRLGATVQQLVDTLHPYLTWAEAVRLGAQMVEGDVSRLSCCA